MTWIKCSERLPIIPEGKSKVKVLAFGISSCDSCFKQEDIFYAKYKPEYGFEFGEYDCPLDAKYWMPLPLPPTEEP